MDSKVQAIISSRLNSRTVLNISRGVFRGGAKRPKPPQLAGHAAFAVRYSDGTRAIAGTFSAAKRGTQAPNVAEVRSAAATRAMVAHAIGKVWVTGDGRPRLCIVPRTDAPRVEAIGRVESIRAAIDGPELPRAPMPETLPMLKPEPVRVLRGFFAAADWPMRLAAMLQSEAAATKASPIAAPKVPRAKRAPTPCASPGLRRRKIAAPKEAAAAAEDPSPKPAPIAAPESVSGSLAGKVVHFLTRGRCYRVAVAN